MTEELRQACLALVLAAVALGGIGCDTGPGEEAVQETALTDTTWQVQSGSLFGSSASLHFSPDHRLRVYNSAGTTCQERTCRGRWSLQGRRLQLIACGDTAEVRVREAGATSLSLRGAEQEVVLGVSGALDAAYRGDAFDPAPAGFTRTDAQGAVLERDAEDWCVAPGFLGEVWVRPASPNPARLSTTLSVDTRRAPLVLCGRTEGGKLVLLDSARGLGEKTLRASEQEGGRGLVRVFLFSAPTASCKSSHSLVTYGDIYFDDT